MQALGIKYQDIFLTVQNFNDAVSANKNVYRCWSASGFLSRKHMSEGKNLICMVSESMLIDRNLIRKYIYIGFIKRLKIFFQNYPGDTAGLHYYFIPVPGNKLAEVNQIMEDIKDKNKNTNATI